MNPMSLSSHKLLRLFVLLLLTLFISETVYASGMMVSVEVTPSHAEAQAEHCHEVQLVQQAHEKQHAHANCKDCGHCFACFSMMVQAPLSSPALQKTVIATALFVEIYHSPSTAQPQKPPIA
ncbi:conserved hypothetical protein [Methylotenera versatilis 301]|uniref:DUF2946 domain-containing protein n=2 Tax=Methylotenera TaxID=359407 RepID=D7DIV0_METV0|nr:conserved hypothetical protein [Methylotenera versatilis 301]